MSLEIAEETWPVLDWTLESLHGDQSLGPPMAEDDWSSWWMSRNWIRAVALGEGEIGSVDCTVLAPVTPFLDPEDKWLIDLHAEVQIAVVLCDSLHQLLSVIERFRPLLELSRQNPLDRATNYQALRVCLTDPDGRPVK